MKICQEKCQSDESTETMYNIKILGYTNRSAENINLRFNDKFNAGEIEHVFHAQTLDSVYLKNDPVEIKIAKQKNTQVTMVDE